MVVERKIAAEEGKTRHDYGDAFIDKIWQWKLNPALYQMRRLGNSVDWGARRFWTKVFQCREKSLSPVQRPDLPWQRTVNCRTRSCAPAISVRKWKTREVKGSMWHIRYPLADGAKTADGKDYWSSPPPVRKLFSAIPAWP